MYTLAWLGLRLVLEDAEVISEHVRTIGSAGLSAFASSAADEVPEGAASGVTDAGIGNLLLRFLSPMYFLETTILDPSMLGDPFSREREFVKMYHKGKVLSRLSPISRFQKRFYRACNWSWKSFLAQGFFVVQVFSLQFSVVFICSTFQVWKVSGSGINIVYLGCGVWICRQTPSGPRAALRFEALVF